MNRFMTVLGLFISATLFSSVARADVSSLSCCGVSNRFVEEANRYIHMAEDAANDAVEQYVSVFNFDKGSDKFGISGNASLGRLTTPRFSCSDPKAVLHSGMGDFGIRPRYLVTTRLFGMNLSVIDASMQGAQAKQAEKNPDPNRSSGIRFSVKIMGIEVISKSRQGPATNAKNTKNPEPPSPADLLPTAQKTGTGGKLLDISRSISQTTGSAIRIPIFTGIFIEFDAGFYLQSNLTFTYGVRSGQLFSFGGGGSIGSPLGRNPANATDQYCEAPPSDSGSQLPVCKTVPAALPKKGPSFYSDLGSRVVGQVDRFKDLQQQIRSIKVSEFARDAKMAANGAKETFETIANPSTSFEDKCSLISSLGIESKVAPFVSDVQRVQATYENARGLLTEGAQLYKEISTLVNVKENGFPEVTADAGIALDGRVGGWAAAVLALDLGIAKGWVGVKGYLTLIDLRIGLGAALSTKSQYLDLTSDLQMILLSGGIDAIWGVKVGVGEFAYTLEGAYNLFQFPGVRSQNQWLIGRLDFRALNARSPKSPLFWCVNLFGNSVDPDRCQDGDVANSEVAPGLAAHAEFRKQYLGENTMNETPGCVLNDGGVPVYTSDNAADCSTILPGNSSTDLAKAANGDLHPIAQYFHRNPAAFITNLRTSTNLPVKVLSADTSSTTSGVQEYTGAVGILPPNLVPLTMNNKTFSVLQFTDAPAPGVERDTAPLSQKIMTIASRAQLIPGTDPSGAPANVIASSTDPRILIDLTWMSSSIWATNGWTTIPSPRDVRIATGDIGALSNDAILELAKNFRMGRCSAREETDEVYLNLAGVPYPVDGDTVGKSSVNALTLKNSPCSLGIDSAPSKNDMKKFAACQLREALAQGACFPPERVENLVKIANLSNTDILAYFLAAAPPEKKITGNVLTKNLQGDRSTIRVAYNEDGDIWRTYRDYYGNPSRGCTMVDIYRYQGGDESSASQYYGGTEPWVYGRVWTGSGTWSSDNRAARYIIFRPTRAYYYVGTANDFEHRVGIGYTEQQNESFSNLQSMPSTPFSKTFLDGGWPAGPSNWNGNVLCDSTDPRSFFRFAGIAQANFISEATGSPDTGKGALLAGAIRECVNQNKCKYTPDAVPDMGGPVLASTCKANLNRTDATSSYPIESNGALQTTGLSDCIERSKEPNFSDANSFCNSPAIKGTIFAYLGLYEDATTGFSSSPVVNATYSLEVKWNNNAIVDTSGATASSDDHRTIGTCTVSHEFNNRVVEIVGVNGPPRVVASSTGDGTNSYACQLYVGTPGASNGSYKYLRSTADDGVIDPASSDLNCWKSLGYTGDTSKDRTLANDYCATLVNSPATLTSLLDSQQTTLVTGGNHTVTLNLQSRRNGNVGSSIDCSISQSDTEWKKLFDTAGCTIRLASANGTVNSQTIRLNYTPATGSTGEAACLSKINSASQCDRITSVQAYIPYAAAGAIVSGFYGDKQILADQTCNGAYTGNDENPTGDNSIVASNQCGMKASLQVSSQNVNLDPIFSEKALTLTSQSISGASQCHTYYQDTIANPAVDHSQQYFCQSKLAAVRKAIFDNANSSPLGSSVYLWYDLISTVSTTNPLPETGGHLPIAVQFSSYYSASGSGPYMPETTCEYGLAPVKNSYGIGVWELYTKTGQVVTENTCVPETITNPADGDQARKCKVFTGGRTILFGGAGPAYLADSASNEYAGKSKAELCSTYMSKMNPISNLVQRDESKRLPLYIVQADANGNLVDSNGRSIVPTETSPASNGSDGPLYCSPSACEMFATINGEDRKIELSFIQSFGMKPMNAGECSDLHTRAAASVCSSFGTEENFADNVPISLRSVYGDKVTILDDCAMTTVPRSCQLGVARLANEQPTILATKPVSLPGAQSLTDHLASFSTPNTQQACADYFATSNVCEVENPYRRSDQHPGEGYGVYRFFAGYATRIQTCYSQLNLEVTPSSLNEGTFNLTWTDLSQSSDAVYQLQYCKGESCDPSVTQLPAHWQTSLAANNGHSLRVAYEIGATYRFRVRMTVPASATSDAITIPWSDPVTATAPSYAPLTLSGSNYPSGFEMNWNSFNPSGPILAVLYQLRFCKVADTDAACDPSTDPNQQDFYYLSSTQMPALFQPQPAKKYSFQVSAVLIRQYPLSQINLPFSNTVTLISPKSPPTDDSTLAYDRCVKEHNLDACKEYLASIAAGPERDHAIQGLYGLLGMDGKELCAQYDWFCLSTTKDECSDEDAKLFAETNTKITVAENLETTVTRDIASLSDGMTKAMAVVKMPMPSNPGEVFQNKVFKVTQYFPETVGYWGFNGQSLTFGFEVSSLFGTYSKECRSGRRDQIEKVKFEPCGMTYSPKIDPETQEGTYVTDFRVVNRCGNEIAFMRREYYLHHSLDKAKSCEVTQSDDWFFEKAGQYLDQSVTFGPRTYLPAPFVSIELPAVSYDELARILRNGDRSTISNDRLNRTMHAITLRKQFKRHESGTMILLKRRYVSSITNNCNFSVSDTYNYGHGLPEHHQRQYCDVVVANAINKGVCFRSDQNGSYYVERYFTSAVTQMGTSQTSVFSPKIRAADKGFLPIQKSGALILEE